MGDEWHPGLNALVDLSNADLVETESDVIRRVAQYFEGVLREHGAKDIKTAVYAPEDFPFGIARVYEAMTAMSPQTVQVFRDMDKARRWLKDGVKDSR